MAVNDLVLQRSVPGDQPAADQDAQRPGQVAVQDSGRQPAAVNRDGDGERRPFDARGRAHGGVQGHERSLLGVEEGKPGAQPAVRRGSNPDIATPCPFVPSKPPQGPRQSAASGAPDAINSYWVNRKTGDSDFLHPGSAILPLGEP
jgi:hypothetical protein